VDFAVSDTGHFMIKSMTGFGRVQADCDGLSMVVELRSVNHRFCDLLIRLPKHLMFLEPSLRKSLQQRFSRGHIELLVQLDGGEKPFVKLALNRELAQQYHHVLEQLRKELGLHEEITLSHIMHHRDLIRSVEGNGHAERQARLMERLLPKAMDALESARRVEGKAIVKDFRSRLRHVERAMDRIQNRMPKVVRGHQRRLTAKVRELMGALEINRDRLAQEVALFAERSDISEEISRMQSHLERFRELMKSREAVGRSLDFLLQEMFREVNTIGSKGNDSNISHEVVTVKGELEKLREQVLNVE
jgi:uncharacterized protein (TIGR00255 family)